MDEKGHTFERKRRQHENGKRGRSVMWAGDMSRGVPFELTLHSRDGRGGISARLRVT